MSGRVVHNNNRHYIRGWPFRTAKGFSRINLKIKCDKFAFLNENNSRDRTESNTLVHMVCSACALFTIYPLQMACTPCAHQVHIL